MILKKPYGFLIKHFRLIHFILFILMVVFSLQSKKVVDFFVNYVKNDYSVTIVDNMASLYISPFLFVVLILILIMLLIVFIILKYKRKPYKLYLITIIHYVLMFVFLLLAIYLMNSLSKGFWSTASARQYRDIFQIFYYPQFILIVIFAVRTMGFDIKKFDFKKDLADLDLDIRDSELVEINFNFDNINTKRTLRRISREMIYYIKENTFIFICILVILLGSIFYLTFKNYEKIDYNYKQGDKINYDSFEVTFEDSILTNLRYDGEIISLDETYLLVKLKIKNIGLKDKKIDYNNMKIYINNKAYYPFFDYGFSFKDYAKPYFGELIKTNEEATYLFAYLLDNKYKNEDFEIVIYKGYAAKKDFTPKTIKVKLNPIEVNNTKVVGKFNLKDEVLFTGSYIGDSSITINNYYIGRKYNYKYESCYEGKCQEYDDTIMADYSLLNRKTLVVLDCDFKLDTKTAYYGNVKSIGGFASDFMKIKYSKDGKEVIMDTLNVTPQNIKDKIVLQVNDNLTDADQVDLIITIRNKSYVINLFSKKKSS